MASYQFALFLLLQSVSVHIPEVSSNAPDEPQFVEPMLNVTVTAGRDVKLTCVVENLGTYKIAWIAYDKSAILTVQEHVITRNPRINVTYDGYRTWTLHISKVNASDAGTYMCQVNTIVARSQFGFINVVVPPNIVDGDSSGDIMVQENANVTLVCSATGTPQPSITWRREDSKKINVNRTHSVVEYTGAELRLTRISRTDMAAYLCIARNGVPPIVSKRIQVSVDFPPMMTIPHQLVGAPEEYSITLECTIEAHPQPLTYWTKGKGDNAMIHQSNKYIIAEEPGEVCYRTHMKLTIRNLRENDFGGYKCVAKNSRGETEGEMKLYKSDPPTTTSTTPPSYYDKIFKGSINKAPNSLSENYRSDDKITPEGHREGGGAFPYVPNPGDPIQIGEIYDDEVFPEGRRRTKMTHGGGGNEAPGGGGKTAEEQRKNAQRDSGHFMRDMFSSAGSIELRLWETSHLCALAIFLYW